MPLPRPPPPLPGRDGRVFALGVAAALGATALLRWASHLPLYRRIVRQFVWWAPDGDGDGGNGSTGSRPDATTTALVLYQEDAEAVEWVNMCVRKVWIVEGVGNGEIGRG